MNDKPTRIVSAQLQHLLDVVERNRDERCNALLDEARAQARQLTRRAHREARARLRSMVLAAREQARQQLASAKAQQHTRLRLQRHRADKELLARAWQPLARRMQQRWQQAGSRRLWINNLLDQASAMLIDRHWRIEHPVDWPEQERTELEAQLGRELGNPPAFAARAEIAAGLRICAGAACIDGTLEGLLRARTRIEALMLATLNECRDDPATGTQPAGNAQ
jgi:vacuolar-type H+-ATPase subunit H